MVPLSPAEETGLGGLSLDSRLRRLFYTLPQAAMLGLTGKLAEEAVRRKLVYLRDGVAEPIRIMLRPIGVMPEQLSYVHHVTLTILDALRRLPDLYLRDLEVRRVVPLDPPEEEWLRACWGPGHRENNPVFGRLDALAEFTSPLWKESLRFMEANLCGVGGIHYVPACEELLCEVILPVLQAREPRLRLERGHDLRELLMQEVLDHLSAIGRPGRTICFIEPRYAGSGPEEQEALARYYHDRHGMTVLHADPTELALSPRTGEVTCGGLVVDLAYRDYEVRDLLALSAGGADIAPVRTLFRQNRIISSIGGEFDHKSGFELLTDPVLAQRHFSAEERHVFHRHVLWTRVLSERRTSLPAGDAGDLVGYVRREREHLVIKPNRSYGGEGVLLGPAADQGEWEAAIDRALGEPEQWVVQRVANIPVSEFPVLDASGALHIEPFYTVMGFAATEDGLGILCRASQKQVVNVAQRGGMCGVLVGHPPGEIVGPAHLPSLAGMTGRAPARDAYPALVARARELVDFEGVLGLLGWDEETCLPEAGRVPRGRQLALIEGLRHERLTDPALGELIEEVAAALPSAAEA